MRSLVAGLAALALGAAAVALPGPSALASPADQALVPASTPAPPTAKVALIGDSTLLGLTYNPSAGRNSDARSVIAAKYDIFWGVASCQRLVAPSCGSNPPPTSLQQMQANAGQLGQVVVIMGGYDDAEIGTGVDAIVNEAARQGVGTVLWLTYRTGDLTYQYASNYVGFNAVLRAKAQQYPLDGAGRLGRLLARPSGVDDRRRRPRELDRAPSRWPTSSSASSTSRRRRAAAGRPRATRRRPRRRSPRPPHRPAPSPPRARSGSSTRVPATATATTSRSAPATP